MAESLPTASLRVIISGGGIGGCALALALQRLGITVLLLEKDTSFRQRKQGYGLTLQQGHRGCQALGLAERLVERDTPSSSHLIFAADGHLVAFFGPAFFTQASLSIEKKQPEKPRKPTKSMTFHPLATPSTSKIVSMDSAPSNSAKPKSKWNPPDTRKSKLHNVHTPRQVLRQLLMEQVSPETIRWGSKVTGYSEDGEGVTVQLDDGETERGDLLVGADGIFSSVRQQLVGDSLNYLGVLVVLGIATSSHPLLRRRVLQTVDGCTRIFIMPFTEEGPFASHDSVMWQLSFPCSESEARRLSCDPSLLREEALSRCGGWHAPLPELLASTPLAHISGSPVWDRQPPLEEHCSARVVLLGDAAHPMSPFKGQGANQALLDACLLAELLAKFPLRQAVREYQKLMCIRATPQVLGSRNSVSRLHSEASLSSEDWATQRGLDPSRVSAVGHIGAWCDEIESEIISALKSSEQKS